MIVGRSNKVQPHRFRFNVPTVDDSVAEWMALQHDHSASLRLLVRESIQRDGYVDVVNRPVAQLPRRGRPSTAEDELEQGEATSPTPAPKVKPAPVEPVPREAAAVEPLPTPLTVEDESDPEPVSPPEDEPETETVDSPAPEPAAAPASSGADVNDMLAMLR